MFTRGSRLYLGLGFGAYLSALLYGIITNGVGSGGVVHTLTHDGAVDSVLGPLTFGYKGGVGDRYGYVVLMAFAACAFVAAGAALAFRDADSASLAELDDTDHAPAAPPKPRANPWPLVSGFGAVLVVLGLAIGPTLFVMGITALSVSALEWTVATWADQAAADSDARRIVRSRILFPLELVGAGVLIVGGIVYCFSRLLLSIHESQAWWVGSIIALVIFVVAVLIGTRPHLSRRVLTTAVVIGAVLVIALGIIGAIRGDVEAGEHAAVPIAAHHQSPATGVSQA
ncbi:MAG: hypothetical protein R2698_05380 [Microthrixaceae bacterium]